MCMLCTMAVRTMTMRMHLAMCVVVSVIARTITVHSCWCLGRTLGTYHLRCRSSSTRLLICLFGIFEGSRLSRRVIVIVVMFVMMMVIMKMVIVSVVMSGLAGYRRR